MTEPNRWADAPETPGQKLVASVGKGQKGRHIISAKLHTGP